MAVSSAADPPPVDARASPGLLGEPQPAKAESGYEEALGEILAIAGLFNQTNTLADGYHIEPDVLPPLE